MDDEGERQPGRLGHGERAERDLGEELVGTVAQAEGITIIPRLTKTSRKAVAAIHSPRSRPSGEGERRAAERARLAGPINTESPAILAIAKQAARLQSGDEGVNEPGDPHRQTRWERAQAEARDEPPDGAGRREQGPTRPSRCRKSARRPTQQCQCWVISGIGTSSNVAISAISISPSQTRPSAIVASKLELGRARAARANRRAPTRRRARAAGYSP